MRPTTVTQSAAGTSAWIPLDYKQSPFNVGIGVLVGGTVTYTVEHTFDDIWDSTITPTVYPHATLVTQTTNKDGNYAFPIRATRITVTAGTGSATMTLLQGLR